MFRVFDHPETIIALDYKRGWVVSHKQVAYAINKEYPTAIVTLD